MQKRAGTIIFIALVLGVFAFMLSVIFQQKPANKRTTQTGITQPQVNPEILAADKLDHTGEYAAAAQKLETFISSSPSQEDANKASLKLAAAYFNDKDYDKAIRQYEAILQNTETYKVAALHGLAYTYHAKGDKQRAIDYLRQAIAYMQATGGKNVELSIASDEMAIKALEGK